MHLNAQKIQNQGENTEIIFFKLFIVVKKFELPKAWVTIVEIIEHAIVKGDFFGEVFYTFVSVKLKQIEVIKEMS